MTTEKHIRNAFDEWMRTGDGQAVRKYGDAYPILNPVSSRERSCFLPHVCNRLPILGLKTVAFADKPKCHGNECKWTGELFLFSK